LPSRVVWIARACFVFLLLFGPLGCRSSSTPNPAEDFTKVRSDFLQGNLVLAQQKAAEASDKLMAREPAWSLKFRLLDAEILSFQGRSADVVSVLSDQKQHFPEVGDPAIKRNMLLSLAHARLGQTAQSDAELHEAERLSAASHSDLDGEILRTRGILETRRDQQANAEDSYRRSLAIARAKKDQFLEASDLLNLGFVALHIEHYGEALDKFDASSQIARAIGAHIILQTDLGNAGWTYYRLGDFEKALASFQQAEEQAKTLGATDNQILWLNSAGLSLYQLGDLKQAQRYYEDSLQAAEASHNTTLAGEAHTTLGLLLLKTGQVVQAKAHADEALRSAQKVGNNEPEAVLLEGLIAVHQGERAEAQRLLAQVYHDAAQMPSLRWQAENAFANMYAEQHQGQKAVQWYRKSISTFEAQRASVEDEESKLPFFANGDALYRDYAEFLIALHRSDEALQLLDLARARTLEEGLGAAPQLSRSQQATMHRVVTDKKATLRLAAASPEAATSEELNPTRLDAQAVARKLNATILFYSLGPQKSYLWAIQGGATHLFILPQESEIVSRVKSYEATVLKSADPLRDANAEAEWLYSTLVGPAESLIHERSRVFVIPSGILSGLNFETLLKPSPEGPRYWIEEVSITNANSVRLLSRYAASIASNHAPKIGAGRLLLIGNPLSTDSEYPPLPNAAAEVASIQRYFSPNERTVLTQADAVPSAYAANRPEQYSYIHFVAHGTASSLSPLDSAVVLSPSPSRPDDFRLYARDVVQQPLRARLVTISACYGSGLRTYAGEGLVGLSWAFLRAGAHHVIGTLWEINDAATPQLMDQLYRELAAGKEPDQALRLAKLSLLHSQGVYRKPLYWAPFQLYAGS
jgi:CHAT domain-containing protein/tetratricopeptide (TPR) repeat protein